jgi:hypothetical protein
MRINSIIEVRNNLIKNIEFEFTNEDLDLIDERLAEILESENLTLDELDNYCWLNSAEMFDCIFDGKEFDKNNF